MKPEDMAKTAHEAKEIKDMWDDLCDIKTIFANVNAGYGYDRNKEGQLQFPFLAHSWHGASYHRNSAHFSRNGRDGRIAVSGVIFRGDFQGK